MNTLTISVPSLNGRNHYNTKATINMVSHLIIIYLKLPFISIPLASK